MSGLPPLQLSSGPAVSGAPNTGGAGATGAFYTTRSEMAWQERLASAAPVLILGVGLWLLMRNKRRR